MRLKKARVTKYRSIRDTGWFEIEHGKTILVGPNEAGKTALLQALQQLNPPKGTRSFDPLRDYPRSEYNDITTGKVKPENMTVVVAHFEVQEEDTDEVPDEYRACTYVYGRKLDNAAWHDLAGGPPRSTFGAIKENLARLCAHIDPRAPRSPEGAPRLNQSSVKPAFDDRGQFGAGKHHGLCTKLGRQ
jgi:energy-coupling factor transporter ATP-binding protein EcfA2